MKKIVILIILLLSIISCEKKLTIINMSFMETGCANPWNNSEKYNVDASIDPDYQNRIKDFLRQLNIRIVELSITNDGISSGCYACICTTGRRINISIYAEDKEMAEDIGFYEVIPFKDDEQTCNKSILIGNEIFTSYPNDFLIISDVKLENDCLQISFGASGCNGQSWIIELVGSADILYSDPPQRQIRLSLKNYELCQAAFGKTMTFNLKPSRISSGEIILNLTGWNSPIRYKY